jgi:phage terminase small subunit
MDELTPKIKRFCEEYIKDLNGTQAAIRAGYSQKTANEQSSKLLAKVNVQDFLSKLKQNISDKNEGLAQQVIDELKKLGFSNIQDYIGKENEIKDLSTITRDNASAVESIKKTVTEFSGGSESSGKKTTVQFKLYDKISALEKLGRHLGIFELDNQQKAAVINVNITDDEEPDNG